MEEEPIIVAIDVGTTKVCTLVAREERPGELRILGVGIEPSQGVRKGVVVDMLAASQAVVRSVEKAERSCGLEIDAALVGLARTQDGRRWMDRIKLRLPLFGPLFFKLEVARLTRTLGTLMNSGIPVITAMEISQKISQNHVMTEATEHIKEGVHRGETIANAVRATGLFPPVVFHVIQTGQMTGTVEDGLLNILDEGWLAAMEITKKFVDAGTVHRPRQLEELGAGARGRAARAERLGPLFLTVRLQLGVQAIEQVLPMVEIPVEVDFAEQQAEVLEVLHR